jgi:hypothetical protein
VASKIFKELLCQRPDATATFLHDPSLFETRKKKFILAGT